MSYADKLKQHTTITTMNAAKPNQFNQPPPSKQIKPADITFAETPTTTKPPAKPQNTPATTTTQTTMMTTTDTPPFDYQAELKRVTQEIETNLKAKFESAIAHLNQTIINLDKKFEKKLNQHMAQIQTTRADKATQDTHTRELTQIVKQLGYLVNQISKLLGKPLPPMLMDGIGNS